jgi:DNA-binding GntR family transcriptional regulator
MKPSSAATGGLDFAPVSSRRTVQDGVYLRLSEALMSGRLDPGQQLTIASIAEMCGTSHMPVREALRRLAGENALEVASTGSAYVPPVSRERLDDLCEARIINESAAGARAVASVTPRMIRAMEAVMAEYFDAAREHDLAGMTSRNQEFHFTLYRASNSPVLVRIIEALWLQFGPYLRLLTRRVEPSLQPLEPDTYTRHHYDMLDALKQGDAQALGAAIAADIKATRALLRPLCEEAARQSA